MNLFDPQLEVRQTLTLDPGTRFLLLDLDRARRDGNPVLASGGKTLVQSSTTEELRAAVEGVAGTPAVILLRAVKPPREVTVGETRVEDLRFDAGQGLLWLRFVHTSTPRELCVRFGGGRDSGLQP